MPKTLLQSFTGMVILACWVAAFISGVFSHDWQGLTIITPVMLIFAGYMFGESFFQRKAKNGTS